LLLCGRDYWYIKSGKKHKVFYMDVQKQVEFWKVSAEEDFAAAESLLEKEHFRHCLFFAHLAIEKMLKAHVTRQTNDIPPRIHNLIRLAEIAELPLNTEQENFLSRFDVYQIEGRYPDSIQIRLDLKSARQKLDSAEEILEWLKAQL
jgi:HEPN domain-containing protein